MYFGFYYHISLLFSQVDFRTKLCSQKRMPIHQDSILFTHKLAAQSSYLPQVCLFRGRPQPRYLLSIKPTGEDRSLVPLGEELARAVPLNHAALPGGGDRLYRQPSCPNSLPDRVFHALHEFSHIRHCIFAVFLHQFHDGGSYDDTI